MLYNSVTLCPELGCLVRRGVPGMPGVHRKFGSPEQSSGRGPSRTLDCLQKLIKFLFKLFQSALHAGCRTGRIKTIFFLNDEDFG